MFMTVFFWSQSITNNENPLQFYLLKKTQNSSVAKFTIQGINKFPRCESPKFITIISEPDNCSPVLADTYRTAHCQN